jgi:hypothetical protein
MMALLYDPVIPLLGMYLKELTSGYNRDTCSLMFMATLFIIVKVCKQPRCPTTDGWIKKMCMWVCVYN